MNNLKVGDRVRVVIAQEEFDTHIIARSDGKVLVPYEAGHMYDSKKPAWWIHVCAVGAHADRVLKRLCPTVESIKKRQ